MPVVPAVAHGAKVETMSVATEALDRRSIDCMVVRFLGCNNEAIKSLAGGDARRQQRTPRRRAQIYLQRPLSQAIGAMPGAAI